MNCLKCNARPATECGGLCYWCHENKPAEQAVLVHKLVALVRDHGHPARITHGNAALRVASRNVTSAGKAFWHVETVAATRDAVMTWLGY